MRFLQEVGTWLGALDWPEFLRMLKQLHDYRELLVLAVAFATAIALMFVRRTLRRTVEEIKREVGSAKNELGISSRAFKDDIDNAVGGLRITMDATLERVDMAGDAMAKKLDFAKKELEGTIEDALLRLSTGAVKAPAVEPPKFDGWDSLKVLWDETKKELETRIATVVGQLNDGRRRRRYANMDRRDYETVILKLYEDNWIDDDAADALLEMNLMFNARKNRKRVVKQDELAQFVEWRNEWLQSAQVDKPRVSVNRAPMAAE